MKKLTPFIAIAIMSLSTVFAQTPVVVVKTKQPVKVTKVVTKADVKKAEIQIAKAKTTPIVVKKVTVVTPGPTKKDGTADMRYKANKAVKVVGPIKKDGTADMRYKANKAAKKTN